MPSYDNKTPLEDVYLEHTDNRAAFYHVRIYENGSKYDVTVSWGRIGTEGQTTKKSSLSSLARARERMIDLANKKRSRGYKSATVTKNQKMRKKSTRASVIKRQPHSLSRFADILD